MSAFAWSRRRVALVVWPTCTHAPRRSIVDDWTGRGEAVRLAPDLPRQPFLHRLRTGVGDRDAAAVKGHTGWSGTGVVVESGAVYRVHPMSTDAANRPTHPIAGTLWHVEALTTNRRLNQLQRSAGDRAHVCRPEARAVPGVVWGAPDRHVGGGYTGDLRRVTGRPIMRIRPDGA